MVILCRLGNKKLFHFIKFNGTGDIFNVSFSFIHLNGLLEGGMAAEKRAEDLKIHNMRLFEAAIFHTFTPLFVIDKVNVN